MSAIRIVTDSTAYLPQELIDARAIKVVPLKVNFGTEVFSEGVDLSNDEFYERLKHVEKLPTTSQPSVGDFKLAYEELLGGGADGIISIHIGEGISGTAQSARAAAAELAGAQIAVVNSRVTGPALAMIVIRIAEEIEAGKTLPELTALAEELALSTRMLFVVDTLEYLHKGGRIGGAKAFMGSMLNVKPILGLQNIIEPVDKARGSAKAVSRMIELAQEELAGRRAKIAFTHSRNLEGIMQVKDQVVQALNCDPDPVIINETGPVIGTHVGPGTLGLAFYPL